MAWTVALHLDADKAAVGNATAIWNAGELDEFTHSGRLNAGDPEAVAAFATEAKAALALRDKKATDKSPLETVLAAALNKAVTP